METAERIKEVTALMTRRAELLVEFSAAVAKVDELEAQGQEIDQKLAELIGITPTDANGEKKQMTCSHCHEKGHNKKGCPQLKGNQNA